MSLTLRDAQHLSWKTFKKFEMAEQTNSKAHATGEDLIKKSVEVAQKIQKLQNPDTAANKTEFAKLLSELLFSTFILAEQQGVSLEESFLQAIDEMILRSVS